jgi:hypothetical protein
MPQEALRQQLAQQALLLRVEPAGQVELIDQAALLLLAAKVV